jgi:hypothetical protein
MHNPQVMMASHGHLIEDNVGRLSKGVVTFLVHVNAGDRIFLHVEWQTKYGMSRPPINGVRCHSSWCHLNDLSTSQLDGVADVVDCVGFASSCKNIITV